MTTSSRGLGNSPLGSAAYGYGQPATAPALGGVVYRGDDGRRYGSRKIGRSLTTVGQVEYDSYGRAKGQPDVEHMVTLVALMLQDSSVVAGLGHRFFESRHVTPNLQQEQEQRVAEAFKDLVGQGFIRIDSVKVEPRNGMPSITRIQLFNLTSGLPLDELTVIG